MRNISAHVLGWLFPVGGMAYRLSFFRWCRLLFCVLAVGILGSCAAPDPLVQNSNSRQSAEQSGEQLSGVEPSPELATPTTNPSAPPSSDPDLPDQFDSEHPILESKDARKISGASARGNYLAGLLADKRGQKQVAGDFMLRALESIPDNPDILNRAHILMIEENRFDEADRLAERILKQQPDAVLANLVRIVSAIGADDLDLAERRLGKISRKNLGRYFGPLLSAWILAGRGETDLALKALEELSENSAFAILHELHVGLIYDVAGYTTQAQERYAHLLDSGVPTTFRLLEILINFFERTGNHEKIEALRQMYADSEADWFFAESLAHDDGLKKAVRNVRDGVAETFYNIARALYKEDVHEMALIYIRFALYLRPDMPVFAVLAGEILESQERWLAAREMYRQVDPQTPYRWLVDIRIAMITDILGETEDAVALLQHVTGMYPERTDALINLGDLLSGQKRYEEAIAVYDKAIDQIGDLDTRHWNLLYARGISLERAKQWQRAESDFLQALELKPDQPYVLNYLGYSWVEQGVHLERAQKMIERAVQLKPHDGYIVDSLGWALYHLGDLEGAVRELERAVELRPQDPTINDHLGDAYWRVGRFSEARFQWGRALSLDPDPDAAIEIRKKLDDHQHSKHTRRSDSEL